ncbi:MAG: S8 family serine peptidase [Acidobacteriota bacterium]
MRRIQLSLLLIAVGLGAVPVTALAAPGDLSTIHLKSGDVPVSPEAFARLLGELDGRVRATAGSNLHFLVQLDHDPSAGERENFSAAGLDLGDYAGDRSWIAAVPADRAAEVLRLPGIRFASAWGAERKIDPNVRAGRFGPQSRHPKMPGRIKLFVSLQRDVPLERGASLAEDLGAIPLDPVSAVHGLAIWLPEGRLAALAAREEVLWIGEEPAALGPLNDGILAQTRVRSVHATYGLDGAGTRVFVYDAGTVDDTHPTFDEGNGSRVKVIDQEPVAEHSTHVAGTLAGDGSDDPNGGTRGRGVAPAAQLFSAGVSFKTSPFTDEFVSNLGDFEKDYTSAVNDFGIDVANNSIGLAVSGAGDTCIAQGDYGIYGRAVDNLIAGKDPAIHRPVILSWAIGNERGHPDCGTDYGTIGPPGCAKNIVGVGAIDSDGGAMTVFSGWGPCDDGSLKPTLVSPGCETGRVTQEFGIYSSVPGGEYSSIVPGSNAPWCGTSMAAPSVTGTIALLIQDWRKRGHAGSDEQPMPALVRAMLAHTAHDRGPVGPDYEYGYGLMDAKDLIDLERADDGKLNNGDRPQWGTDEITKPSTVRDYQILVPADLPSLKATLAWDDPAPAEFALKPLVNDLTLELISPLGVHVQAWVLDSQKPELPATHGANKVDTLEQVVADHPEQGIWTVRVNAGSLPSGPQSFGLVYAWQEQIADECTTDLTNFESGKGKWSLTGATVDVDPNGGGNHALALDKKDEASLLVVLPSVMAKAELRFRALVDTSEANGSNEFRDFLNTEIRDPGTGQVLAVVDQRDSGWPKDTWIDSKGIDLTPWLGKKVLVVFRASDDGDANTSTFFVDDVEIETCLPPDFGPHFTFNSTAGQDGSVIEEGENGNVGGMVQPVVGPNDTIDIGDTAKNEQVKGFVSFDTSWLPDALPLTGAVVRLKLKTNLGDAQLVLGQCQVDVHHKGGFSLSPVLEKGDFEAQATVTNASPLGYADPGEWSNANLFNPQPWNPNATPPIDPKGVTQVRLYCPKDDNNDQKANLARYWSGAAAAGDRPQLILEYDPQ